MLAGSCSAADVCSAVASHNMTACKVQLSCLTSCVVLCRFNVYVAQPEVKPGCVLRRSNVRVLESRKLVSNDEASAD